MDHGDSGTSTTFLASFSCPGCVVHGDDGAKTSTSLASFCHAFCVVYGDNSVMTRMLTNNTKFKFVICVLHNIPECQQHCQQDFSFSFLIFVPENILIKIELTFT
jgi:hypothetical protein